MQNCHHPLRSSHWLYLLIFISIPFVVWAKLQVLPTFDDWNTLSQHYEGGFRYVFYRHDSFGDPSTNSLSISILTIISGFRCSAIYASSSDISSIQSSSSSCAGNCSSANCHKPSLQPSSTSLQPYLPPYGRVTP